ncbi:MAG: alanyl-tRNA editing protein [Myxococcales bacterium]|nr:alanyl-tRNA editing protein [Myxococcales bacterium]
MTPRLYFDDPFLSAFDARVVAHGSFAGWTSVVLDRTGLYPEAGGQMADRGSMRFGETEAAVVDVQVDDNGVVHHRLDHSPGALPAPGVAVSARVDARRRRVHMALHTGQHMLSRALLDEAAAPTVSARLGETACTIDLDVAALDERAASRAEALVNDVIDDDRIIRAFFPAPEELAGLALRRAPKVERDVRVVDIEGFDVSPCGGTHATRTSQVALVKITSVERYKGRVRLGFVAGARARAELGRAHDALAALARDMTCGPAGVPGAIGKLRAELSSARDAARGYGTDLARFLAAELVRGAAARGENCVVATLSLAGMEPLRAAGAAIVTDLRGAALLAAPTTDGLAVLVTRHPSSPVDCGKILRAIASAGGGRGGGKPEHAEGRLPAGADFVALATAALTAPPA